MHSHMFFDIYGNSLLSLMSSDRCTDPLVYLEELFSSVFPDCDTHGQLQYGGCPLYLKIPHLLYGNVSLLQKILVIFKCTGCP